jgi:hypothetical protein
MKRLLALTLSASLIFGANLANAQPPDSIKKAEILTSVQQISALQCFFQNGGAVTIGAAVGGAALTVYWVGQKTIVKAGDVLTNLIRDNLAAKAGTHPLNIGVENVTLAYARTPLNYTKTGREYFSVTYKAKPPGKSVSVILQPAEVPGALPVARLMTKWELASKGAVVLTVFAGAAIFAYAVYGALKEKDAAVTADDLQKERIETALNYDLNGAKTVPVPLAAILRDAEIRDTIAATHALVMAGKEQIERD